jgi:hypothetical protein
VSSLAGCGGEVERPDGRRLALYGVSVFARQAGGDTGELLRRFAASHFYLATTVPQVRAAGFDVLPTGTNPDHFDVLLFDSQSPDQPMLARAEVEAAARRLVEACGEMRPSASYAEESMAEPRANPWYVREIDSGVVQRLSRGNRAPPARRRDGR